MRFKDYYRILGVSERASKEEVKKAFRQQAKKYHPDTNPGNKAAEEQFKELSEAYDILSDGGKRDKYDQLRFYGRADGRNGNWITFDPEFLRSHGWPVGGTRNNMGNYAGQGFAFSDLLRDIFGVNGYSSTFEQPQPPQDINGAIQITLLEALQGTEKTIAIRQRKRCTVCGGNGQDRYSPCSRCNGSGRVASKKKIRIRLPAGVEDGHQMRLRGLGQEAIYGNGQAGDVIITVNVKAHPFFSRSGTDIYCEAHVEQHYLERGTRIRIPTIEGRQIELNIPAGTKHGTVFRLKNCGMKAATSKGNQYIKIV